jgi:DNA-binding transcriptional MerR regulator
MYSIGQLSQKTGVSTKTIRYYERIELLSRPKRAENGYRQYDQNDVEQLQFIRRSRALDFALDEIREILDFRERHEPPCTFVMSVMKDRIGEIDQRIQDLENLRDNLTTLYEAGKHLPEDEQMRTCVCHLIQISGSV